MTREHFNHQAPYIATRIRVELKKSNKTYVSTGTGFFVGIEIEVPNGNMGTILLMVSNKHVLLHGKGKLTLKLNRKTVEGKPDLGNTETFITDRFDQIYFGHPNTDVDLACVNISGIASTEAHLMQVGPDLLTPIDYEKVALGNEVLFVGYPNGYYDEVNNLPLVRKGSLASLPDIDFEGKGIVVIDAQVFAGSSGSPVFVDWDNQYRLLVVISETVEGFTPSKFPAVLGLGLVIKQRHVKELVEYAVKKIKLGLETAQGVSGPNAQ